MRFYVVTLGCPKNQVDSEGIDTLLTEAGHSPAERCDEADLVIVNTCGFIDAAKEESLGELKALASTKRPGSYLVAAGCLAQREGQALSNQVDGIDAVIGCRSWPDIARLVDALEQSSAISYQPPAISHQASGPRPQDFGPPERLGGSLALQHSALSTQHSTLSPIPHPPSPVAVFLDSELQLGAVRRKPRAGSAYVKIADGCDASCAFCAIPAIKGPYKSKSREAILDEIRQLMGEQSAISHQQSAVGYQSSAVGQKSSGLRTSSIPYPPSPIPHEIVLVGQDSTAYGLDRGERDGLATLLHDITDTVPDLPWLRVLYLYPQRMTPELLWTMAELPQVCKYVDIPLQHTHPAVLERMRRPRGDVRRLVAGIREAIPDVAIRTTFIVGFPGETAAEHNHLLRSIDDLKLDHVGIFVYSSQDGTPAASMQGQVPAHTAQRRWREAMEVAQKVSLRRNRKLVGAELDVLVEGVEKVENGREPMMVGRSYRDAPEVDGLVLFSGKATPGEIVRVRITAALEYDLVGDQVTSGDRA